MKKDYESPKAEKIDFNYTEAVTASGGQSGQASENPTLQQVWVGNQTFPSPTNCAKQWRYVC